MRVRDATEAEAERLADLTGTSIEAAREMVRDRTVRLCLDDGDVVAVVCFTATSGAVHVTRLAGDPTAYPRLLEEPLRFAASSELPVETVLPPGEDAVRTELEAAGFEAVGEGPRFRGERTIRYRHEG